MAEKDIGYQWFQISVGGVPYRWEIDPTLYTERDIVDFAPRAGGGDVAYSNLDLYQIYTQDSWHHGLGFIQARDKFGYRITDGDIDTRHIGLLMQSTAYAVDYAGPPTFYIIKAVDFKGATFAITYDKILKRTPTGTWTEVYVLSAGLPQFTDLVTNGEYLMASLSLTGQMLVSSTGASWSNAGPSGNPPLGFTHLVIHNGFMWGVDRTSTVRTLTGNVLTTGAIAAGSVVTIAGSLSQWQVELSANEVIKIGATLVAKVSQIFSQTSMSIRVQVGATLSGGETITKRINSTYNALHFWSASDSSDAEGGGTDDVAAIIVGSGSYNVNNLVSFNGALYVGCENGVWVVDETVSPPVTRRVIDFSDEAASDNCRIMLPWKGRLYLNVGNSLFAYTGASMVNVTPPTYSLDFPPAAFGMFGKLASGSSLPWSQLATYHGSFLYLLAKDNLNKNTRVLAFDGTGWHVICTLANYPAEIYGLSYSVAAGGLVTSLAYGDGAILLIRFQPGSELPYTYFNTAVGRNYIDLSEIDAGFRRVPKSFAEIDLETVNPAGTSVIPYFYDSGQLSGNPAGWTRLGAITTSGLNTLDFSPTHEDYKLLVRLYFQTTDGTKSAIVRNITVKYMLRPEVLYGHRLVLLGGDEVHMLDGRTLKASSEQQRAWLKAARASRAPVQIITPFGEAKTGYISTLQFSNLLRRAGEPRSNWTAVVNLVEVR